MSLDLTLPAQTGLTAVSAWSADEAQNPNRLLRLVIRRRKAKFIREHAFHSNHSIRAVDMWNKRY
jgi:hypothetical protein